MLRDPLDWAWFVFMIIFGVAVFGYVVWWFAYAWWYDRKCAREGRIPYYND